MIEFINKLSALLDISSIFNNVIAWVVTGSVGILGFFFRRLIVRSKSRKKDNILETFIYADPDYIVCKEKNESYIIEDIPDIMLEYRKKLYSTDNTDELFFWDTRISTFIVITDGSRLLVLDRNKNEENQLVHNDGLDCYGAVKFHNPLGSLLSKLPIDFMSVTFKRFESIPGISLEQNCKTLYQFKYPFRKESREIAIMLGFVVYVNKVDLGKGVNDINRIIDLSCLSADDKNLTAKTKLAVKHLLQEKNKRKYRNKLSLKLIASK